MLEKFRIHITKILLITQSRDPVFVDKLSTHAVCLRTEYTSAVLPHQYTDPVQTWVQ